MPKQENITSSELKEFVLYDPNTGIFLRKKTLHHKTSHGVDKKCGSINSRGYVTFMVKRKMYQAHRLAWLYMTGRMPSGEIDHINGDKTDNRFFNLRDLSKSGNQENRVKARRDNSSGFMGISFDKRYKKWVAQIQSNKKRRNIGYYDTPEEAHSAYIKEKKKVHRNYRYA